MYLRGDGREVIECNNGARPNECGSLESSGAPGQIYLDCSDKQFACLFSLGVVLARAVGTQECYFGYPMPSRMTNLTPEGSAGKRQHLVSGYEYDIGTGHGANATSRIGASPGP